MYVEYSSNNSGGSWWLTDENWKALEDAGWMVHWVYLINKIEDKIYARDDKGLPILIHQDEADEQSLKWVFKKSIDENGDYRWMGALATYAYRPDLNMRDAADEFEAVTGLNPTEPGCSCCGQPHTFTEYDDDGKYVTSGPNTDYSCGW